MRGGGRVKPLVTKWAWLTFMFVSATVPSMKTFAEQWVVFDERRTAARVTDEELARRARMPASAISHYRCGRRQPRVDGWARLSSALDDLIRERTEQLQRLA